MAISKRYHAVEAPDTKPNLALVAALPNGSGSLVWDGCEPRPARPSVQPWLWFALQLLAIAALQVGDDVVRGNIDPPNMQEAVRRAQAVAHLEQAHGLFVEPALQLWVRHTHALFGILSYATVVRMTDLIYALGQTLVPLAIAGWIFLRHRSHFPFVRNVAFLSTLLALVGYELYPTAPPRLTSGLVYHHHLFHFQDTVQHVIGDGKLNGIPLGYNAYSAIPSLHIAWALIVAASVVLIAHHPAVRLAAALYPLLMLFTVVVSANHFLLDAAGGALAVALAALVAMILRRWGTPRAPMRSTVRPSQSRGSWRRGHMPLQNRRTRRNIPPDYLRWDMTRSPCPRSVVTAGAAAGGSRRANHRTERKHRSMEKTMFEKLAHLMYRRRWLVLGAWAIVLLVAAALTFRVGSVLGPGDPVSKGSDSDKAAVLLDTQFHQNDQRVSLIVLHNPEATIDSPAFRSAVDGTAARVRADRALQVTYLDNPLVTGNQQLISRDRRSVVLRVSSALTQADIEKQIDHLRQIVRTPGFTTYVTGSPAQSHDNVTQGRKDLAKGDSLTAPILILILLLVFGSLVAASVPLLLALSSILLSLAVVYIFAHFLDTSVVVTNLVAILGLGIGIDYSLFIVYRYREELRASSGDPEAAIVRTMRTTGRAVFFSGLTVAIGISTLILTGVPFMQSLGLGGLLVPLSALAITMTLLPALLGVLGTRINRLRVMPQRFLRTGDSGLWHAMAAVIMRRPLLSGSAVLLLLLALAYPITQLNVAYGSLKNQPQSEESVAGLAFVKANFSSAPSPTQVVIEARHGSLLQAGRLAGLRAFEATIRRDPDVARAVGPADVPSTTPRGHRGPSGTVIAAQVGSIQGHYLSADHRTALISVVGRHALGTQEGDALVRRLRDDAKSASAQALKGDVVYVGGQQAEYTDFNDALYAKFPLIVGIVLVLTYGFLFFAFRSVFLPLKAVLLNLLSVGASYGILQLVFQRGVGSGVLRFTPEDGVVSFVPILLFALLFGLSTDYEVFLLSRVRERWFATGDNRASVGYGLQQTGRLISSAALIMLVAFSGFLIGNEVYLKEFGFGLMAAIAVDATLIRLVLVPSLMAIVGRWNWWVPGFLRDFAGRNATFGEHDFPSELGEELASA